MCCYSSASIYYVSSHLTCTTFHKTLAFVIDLEGRCAHPNKEKRPDPAGRLSALLGCRLQQGIGLDEDVRSDP